MWWCMSCSWSLQTEAAGRKRKKKTRQTKRKAGAVACERFFFFFFESDFEFHYLSQCCKLDCVSTPGLLGPSLCEAQWLAGLTLWHPMEPCFLLNLLYYDLMSTILHLPPSLIPFFFYRFLFLSLSGVAPRLVCHHPFPPSKEDKACD